MDVSAVASQLVGALGNNPDLISQFAQHPYSTTASVTGSDENISQKDMSRILTQVAAQSTGQKLGTNDTKDLASALLGQAGGSVHSLASALFGGAGAGGAAQPAANANAAAAAGGFDLSSILGALTGAGAGNGSANTGASSNAPSMAQIAAQSIAGGIAARGLAALITGALGTNKK